MTTPRIAQKGPFPVEVEAGKTYYWCACGESKTQPFCDGSHRTTSFKPMPHTAEKAGMVYFCGCKASANAPMCDGSHRNL